MAKRGYKLQFAAHTAGVTCLSIGKKTCRLLITGGDDHKVNFWSIGKSSSLMSLCGHTSPIESVAFDSAEILVAAGASSGVIKLWDLEEAKMVRNLNGHRSKCTAVEFHPFGEFFASGSQDTNLRVWDIRKKGSIHTYKGHTQGVNTIRFTPDGRWVVSGGFDNVVKVWDLTAGKLLHDFTFHTGPIQSIDFHPLEFLLATGSADRTVKFWDLETFELIGSTRPEGTGVRSITFHPDGRTLFCGLEDSLKVYSWEPVICHDSVDMGWSSLGDLCIHEGKLFGCSHHRNTVGVWVADVSVIEPYGVGCVPDQSECLEKKLNLQEGRTLERSKSSKEDTSKLRSMSPDYDTKGIKNIYVDSTGGNPVSSRKVGSFNSPKVLPQLDANEITDLPLDSPDGKVLEKSRRATLNTARGSSGILPPSPSHTRTQSDSKYDVESLSMAAESGHFSLFYNSVDKSFQKRLVSEDEAKESSGGKRSNIKSVAEKFDKIISLPIPNNPEDNSGESLSSNKGMTLGKFVKGGRTRSLVERFERRERSNSDEDCTATPTPPVIRETSPSPPVILEISPCPPMIREASPSLPVTREASPSPPLIPETSPSPHAIPEASPSPPLIPEIFRKSPMLEIQPQISERESMSANDENAIEGLMKNHDIFLSGLRSRLTKLQVVRHFWERNDTKAAINAMRKLPDHSVQADVISVLMEKMEILTLDLFSSFLPILLGLLDSKIERHVNVSMEMLLKLVAVFGPVVRSTVSAPPRVGVDLHAEQRLECCKQCFMLLQKVQKIIPSLIRRGGLVSRHAHELNLVLQES